MSICLSLYACTTCRPGAWGGWSLISRVVVRGVDPGNWKQVPIKAAIALNCWAIFPASKLPFITPWGLQVQVRLELQNYNVNKNKEENYDFFFKWKALAFYFWLFSKQYEYGGRLLRDQISVKWNDLNQRQRSWRRKTASFSLY